MRLPDSMRRFTIAAVLAAAPFLARAELAYANSDEAAAAAAARTRALQASISAEPAPARAERPYANSDDVGAAFAARNPTQTPDTALTTPLIATSWTNSDDVRAAIAEQERPLEMASPARGPAVEVGALTPEVAALAAVTGPSEPSAADSPAAEPAPSETWGPEPAGHDDATYPEGPNPARFSGGSPGETVGPGLAHDDVEYPEGTVRVLVGNQDGVWGPGLSHDDTEYPSDTGAAPLASTPSAGEPPVASASAGAPPAVPSSTTKGD